MRQPLSCSAIRTDLAAQRGKTEGTAGIAVVFETTSGARTYCISKYFLKSMTDKHTQVKT